MHNKGADRKVDAGDSPAVRGVNYHFILSFVVILAYIFFRFPSISYNAEVYAETGWLFFVNARSNGAWDNIVQVEVGYIPFIQSLLAVIVVKLLRVVDTYPYFVQGLSAAFIAFFCSFLNLRTFRSVIEDDLVRFFLGITLAFGILTEFEVYTFINFIYFGLVYSILIIYVDKEKLSWPLYSLAVLLSILVNTSKPHFMFFIPVYGLLAAITLSRKQFKSAGLYVATIFVMAYEVVVILRYSQGWITQQYSLASMLNDMFFYYMQSWQEIVFKNLFPSANVIVFALLIAFQAGAVYVLYRRGDKKGLFFFALCCATAIGSLYLTIKTGAWFKHDIRFGDYLLVPHNRHFFFPKTAIYLGLIAVLVRLFPRRAVHASLVALIMLPYALLPIKIYDSYYDFPELHNPPPKVGFFPSAAFDPYPERWMSSSQWGLYKGFINDPDYAIPVNPYPQKMLKGCVDINETAGRFFSDMGYDRYGTLMLGDGSYVNMAKATPWAQFATIRAITCINDGEFQKRASKVNIVAVGPDGKAVGTAAQVTPINYTFQYFRFPEPVRAAGLAISDQDGRPLAIPLKLRFFGTLDVQSMLNFYR